MNENCTIKEEDENKFFQLSIFDESDNEQHQMKIAIILGIGSLYTSNFKNKITMNLHGNHTLHNTKIYTPATRKKACIQQEMC